MNDDERRKVRREVACGLGLVSIAAIIVGALVIGAAYALNVLVAWALERGL